MSAPDQDQKAAEAHALSRQLREQSSNHHHSIQATALLSAYLQTAIANPCCTESCLAQLGKAAFLLAQHVSSPAQGNPIH